MPRKPKRNVPEILWRLYGKRARNLKDTIVDLIPNRNIQPEQCRCRSQGCLRCSREKVSFLLHPGDPNHYRRLLHRCFVVIPEHAPPLLDFSTKCWWSQRQIVERIVEMMESGPGCGNVINVRYEKYDQSSCILDLLASSAWEYLLSRVGHDFMGYLLQHTSIFLPFLGKKHQQVSGPPLSINQNQTFPALQYKRKRDDNVLPSKKRQRLSSAVSDRPKVNSVAVTTIVGMEVGQNREERPRKRSRLSRKRRQKQRRINFKSVDNDAHYITSCTNGNASTGNGADERNPHSSMILGRTEFARQPRQFKGKKPFQFKYAETLSVLPPKHIVRTLRANCSDSKFLMKHIFGEVNAWSTAPSHGKGNCPIGCICLYHALLKSIKSLIGKTKSPHLKALLDKHCPVVLMAEDSLKSANATSQNPDKLHHGSSSEKGKTKCPSVEAPKLYCTKAQVVSFIWAICRYIIPESLLGTTHQMRVLTRNIAWYVSRRKNEKCTVKQFFYKVKPSDFPFFARKQLCCMDKGHELQNESIRSTQQMFCTKWISWLFLEIVKKLVRFNFYVTESQEGRQNIYYYRKCTWERLLSKEFGKSLDIYVPVEKAEAERRRRMRGLSKFRFLPKANGVRMVLDFSSSTRLQSFCGTHAVLKDIQLKEPNVLGSSVFDNDDIYRNLGPYLIDLRSQSGKLPPLFFVVADVFKAYDSVDHDKLLSVVQCLLKDEYILNRCRLVCCRKRSCWVNSVLVSSDKNATYSRFTSSVPYNARQSIMVDQGESHLLKKKDLMRWIENMLRNNMLQLDQTFFVQKTGIPQGHRLSSLLFCFYYGHVERTLIYPFLEKASNDVSAGKGNREKELITPPSYKLLRYIDDYLFVSTSKDQASSFYHRLKHGFPDYNCFMNENKFCINFDDEGASSSSSKMYVGDNGVSFIRWTGWLINSRTFEIQVDYTRYFGGHLSSSISVAWQNKPVKNLRKKLCSFLVPKCHPILFDSNINSGAIVKLNIYQIFLLAAMKFHCYVYELSWFWKFHPQTLYKFITKAIRYLFRLVNRRMHRINTGSSFRPVLKVSKEEVIWLGLHAFIQVLKKKNSRYRTLLNYLSSTLSEQNIPLNLWPGLEYATDRSNSSSLWKLKY